TAVGEHLDVSPEVVRTVRRRVREERRGRNALELHREADLLPVGLHDRLSALTNAVHGRLVEDLELDAALGADPIGSLRPASVVELLVRRREVELANVQ